MASNMAFNILVDLDSKDASAKVDELERKMAELRDQHIKAEIDDAEFKVKYRELEAQLKVLGSQHPNIDVRVEATRAITELAAANREADKLDGRRVNVRVDDDGSSGLFEQRMGAIVQAALLLGPAVAAGLAPGIAALAAGAATAGAFAQGLGVLVGAFSGISAGVKELGNDQIQMSGRAEQSAAQQISSANSIANAQDSLRHSVESVGIAQENAALAVHRASEQAVAAHHDVESAVQHEHDAELSLIDAQRSAARAQDDLTQARVDAQRSLQDMAFSVADNALAQRRAVDDVKAAQAALSQMSAGDPRREAAQLTLEETQQRQAELIEQGKRLAADKATADAKGVEGSKQVTSAQDALTAANKRVEDSQRAIVDATYSVSQAQLHERDAVDAVTRAQVEGGRAVTAAQQSVIQAQRGLESAMAQQAAQAASAQRTTAGLTKAMDDLGPAGQHFAHFLHDEVVPGLKDVREGIQASLLPDMELAIKTIGADLPIFNTGLQGTAAVVGDLSVRGARMMASGPWQADFALIMSANNRALLQWGNAGLSALDATRNLTAAAIPLELHFAAAAEKSLAMFAAWVQGKRDSGELGQWFGKMSTELDHIWHVLTQVATGAWQLFQALTPLGGVTLTLIGDLAQFIGWLSQANPMLVELIAVSAALYPWVDNLSKGYKNLSNIWGKILAQGPAMALSMGAVGIAIAALTVIETAYVTSADQAASAMLRGGAAAAQATEQMKNQSVWNDVLKSGWVQMIPIAGSWAGMLADKLSPGLKQATDNMNAQLKAMDPLTRAQTMAAQAQNDYAFALERQDWAGAAEAQRRYAAANAEVTHQQDLLKRGLDSTTDALKRQQEQVLDMSDTDIRYGDALQRATDSLKEHGRTTDLNTDAGRRNQQALNDLARAAQAQEDQMRKSGATEEMVNRTHEAHRQQLANVARQMGLNEVEAQRLTDKYLAIPPRIVTDMIANTFPAVDAVNRMAGDIRNLLGSIPDEAVTVKFIGAAPNDSGNILRASGGPVFGPGSETSDSIPALLSDNEHVWTAGEVRGAGGHANVERLRHLAALGKIPAFATGGPAVFSQLQTEFGDPGNVAGVNRDYVRAVAERLKRELAEVPAGVGGGVARWAGMVDQALGIMHQPLDYRGITLSRMNQESGGNPTIVNKWDSNWTAGTPSVGLMQVIGPTYRANRVIDVGPYLYGVSVDPLANTLSSMKYAIGRYGSLPSAYGRAGGYANGGIANGPSIVGEAGPEAVLPLNRPHRAARVAAQAGLGGATVNLGPVHVHSDVDIDSLAHRLAFSAAGAGL